MDRQKLIVFVRAPRPGTVKTRLAATIGAQAAADAYRLVTEALLGNLALLPQVEIRYAPDDAAEEVRPWLQPGWLALPQGSGDLGARMHRAFVQSFASGMERVAVIGSDCPSVTAEDIQCAWAELSEHDVVLGPATDGGYWLIALRQAQPSLFEAMPWSTSTVQEVTRARAHAAGLRTCLLRPLTDIDSEKDWIEFCNRQVPSPHANRMDSPEMDRA